MPEQRLSIQINTAIDYVGDYNGLFSAIVRILGGYTNEDVFSNGNLPSEAGVKGARFRTYYTKSGELKVHVNLEKEEAGIINGEIRVTGEEAKISGLKRIIETLGNSDNLERCIFSRIHFFKKPNP
jgi:hypothetical protein